MQEKKPASNTSNVMNKSDAGKETSQNTSNVMNKSDAGKETSQQHKQRDE